MAETNNVPTLTHFNNGRNLTDGSQSSIGASGETLAEFCRHQRRGRETAAGAGDITVTFTVPFPDANYTIQLTGDGVSVPVIKTGSTPAKTGFVITAAGAGPVHWVATHDGRS